MLREVTVPITVVSETIATEHRFWNGKTSFLTGLWTVSGTERLLEHPFLLFFSPTHRDRRWISTGVPIQEGSMREGWLIDRDDCWIWRFWRDESAWVRDPKVFLDRGRLLPGEEPLLKERRYLRKNDAEQLWRSLQTQGWKPLKQPAWGASAEV